MSLKAKAFITVMRIILKGNTDDVLRPVNGYFQEHPLNQSVV